jgi:hypothetical protein
MSNPSTDSNQEENSSLSDWFKGYLPGEWEQMSVMKPPSQAQNEIANPCDFQSDK